MTYISDIVDSMLSTDLRVRKGILEKHLDFESVDKLSMTEEEKKEDNSTLVEGNTEEDDERKQ